MKPRTFTLIVVCFMSPIFAAAQFHVNEVPLVASRPRIMAAYGALPLTFEVNQGQTDARVKFLSRGSGYTLFLTQTEAVLSIRKDQKKLLAINHPSPTEPLDVKKRSNHVLHIKLVGARPASEIQGLNELPGKSNYFIGNDPKKWRTRVSNYAEVRYKNVYPNIDLLYHGTQGRLENDFVVAPGADPSAIRFSLKGARKLRLNADGNLLVRVDGGELLLQKPIIFQERNKSKQIVEGRFLLTAHHEVAFQIDSYDRSEPLVIDPVLTYSTYLGGGASDGGVAIAVDSSGNAYVLGATSSVDFPTTPGAFSRTCNDCAPNSAESAFVAKLNSAGTALVYSTFLGGSSSELVSFFLGGGIAVDSSGNAYVTGATESTDFPLVNPFQTTCSCNESNGFAAAFVTKLNPAGDALLYSTYLGGARFQSASAIAVDGSGNAFLTGRTTSSDFPITSGAFDTTCGTDGACNPTINGILGDAFISEIDTTKAGTASLVYSSFIGGSSTDWGFGIALDSSSNAYVIGLTSSSDFPITPGSVQTALSGPADAFIAKFDTTKSGSTSLVYSTFLGGTDTEYGLGIAVDRSGNAYVTGITFSFDFPVTVGAFQTANAGQGFKADAFISKLNANGSALVYSTYLGGSNFDEGHGIALDPAGNAYVAGRTGSMDFPLANPLQSTFGGGFDDAFVAALNAAGSALIYSTYLGGSSASEDVANGIAVDTTGNAYATGLTFSSDFPTTTGVIQSTFGGVSDAFVVKISPGAAPAPVISSVSPTSGTQGQTISNFTVTGSNFDPAATLSSSGTGISVNSYSSRTGTQIVASISIASNAPVGPYDVIVTNPNGQQGILSNAFAVLVLPPKVSVNPQQLAFGSVPVGEFQELTLTITNIGGGLLIGNASVGPPFSLVGSGALTIAPSLSQILTLSFIPSSAGTFIGSLLITTNGGNNTVALQGVGFVGKQYVKGHITTDATDHPPVPNVAVVRLDSGLGFKETTFTGASGQYFFTDFSSKDYIAPVSSGTVAISDDSNPGPHGYIFALPGFPNVSAFCQVNGSPANRQCQGNNSVQIGDFVGFFKPSSLDPPITFKMPVPSGDWRVGTETGGFVLGIGGIVDADPSHTDVSKSGYYAVDFPGACGKPILAVADGDVVFADAKGDFGTVVVLRHPGQTYSLYAHLDSIAAGIHKPVHVTQGTTLGFMGKTGKAFGTHLHFQFYNGGFFDPTKSQSSDQLLRQVRLETSTGAVALGEFIAGRSYTSTNIDTGSLLVCSGN